MAEARARSDGWTRGFDSILEELYPAFGKAVRERGYSVLMYEGPGQAEPLRKYGLPLTAEWERPIAPYFKSFSKPIRSPQRQS